MSMPEKPNWVRTHDDLRRGNLAFKHFTELEPMSKIVALEAEHPIINSNFQKNTKSSSLQVLLYQAAPPHVFPNRRTSAFAIDLSLETSPSSIRALEADHPIIDSNFQTNTKSSSLQVLLYQEEEEELVMSMPKKPNWVRTHGDLRRGNLAFKHFTELEFGNTLEKMNWRLLMG
ncbi:hypothetical protein TB2_005670 [Malus domestica]